MAKCGKKSINKTLRTSREDPELPFPSSLSSEELQSLYEEIQSTNEELGAANEELQSTNEELVTVNEELQTKIEELSKANNDIANLITSTEIGMIFLDKKFNIQRFTPSAKKIFRLIKSDIGRCVFDINSNLDYPHLNRDFRRVVREEKLFMIEVRSKKGEWYNMHLTPYRKEDKTVDGIVAAFIDITGKKQSETALKESESKYKSLFEHMNNAFALHKVITNKAGRPVDYEYLEANQAFSKLTGLRNVVGKRVTKLLPGIEKDPADWIGKFGKVAISGKDLRYEQYAEPLKMWYSVLAYCPQKGHFAVLFENITERKNQEILIRLSEEKFRKFVEFSPTGILVIDENWKYVFSNEAAFNMTGYSQIELLQMKITDLVIPEEQEKCLAMGKILFSEGKINGTTRLKRKDGRIIDVIIDVVSIGENQYLGFHTDISKLKSMEEQAHQNDKMMAIGQLAGGVAHDFNNQLAAIQTFADLIQCESDPNSNAASYAKNILTCASRSAGLTRQLLAFAHKGKYISKTMDVNEIIREVINLLSRSFDKKLGIHQKLWDSHLNIEGDPSQIQNAFLNLALNSRDAMPQGGALTFSTRPVFLDEKFCANTSHDITSGDYAEITVTDTGTGMSADVKDRVFEPFFTTKKLGEGTGMGLAAVFGTIRNHKGYIEINSKPGRGTTVRMILPLSNTGFQETVGSTCSPANKKRARIMVVDDEELINKSMEIVLLGAGHEVIICMNGKEALTRYKKEWQSIDLVIMDMIMPKMDGTEAFKMMKKINPDVRVLLQSGYSVTDSGNKLLEMGIAGFIQKPVSMNELLEKVAEALK